MRDREADAQFGPWDMLISVKLFLDVTETGLFPGTSAQSAGAPDHKKFKRLEAQNLLESSKKPFFAFKICAI